MSDTQAIAAVTAALRARLDRAVGGAIPGTVITTQPLDRARAEAGANQLNLYLYLVSPNTAFRNLDTGARPPPLALNLHYLLSAYGASDDDLAAHRLLACAMKALHDEPVVSPAELRAARPDSGVHRQRERVRIAHQPLPVDEMSKWWTMFQTPYRLSVAYEVAVVLMGDEAGAPMGPPR